MINGLDQLDKVLLQMTILIVYKIKMEIVHLTLKITWCNDIQIYKTFFFFFVANLKYTKLSFKLILIWRRFCQINPRAKGEFLVTKIIYELQTQQSYYFLV